MTHKAIKNLTRQQKKYVAPAFFSWHGFVMQTAHDIIAAAGGRQAVASAVNVSPENVTNLAGAGKLPAAWFAALERLTGEQLPRHLFTFKGDAA